MTDTVQSALVEMGHEASTAPARDTIETDILRGDILQLGRHRLLCGDCTCQDDVSRLLDGVGIDCLITDPPYCSGGFQEAGKSRGSIGSTVKITKGAKTVYDPFAGSGTTLIACETRGRSCYAVEMVPEFCQIIVNRWERASGQRAVIL